MAIVNNSTEGVDTLFDCITKEAERQRLKHPEHVDAIGAAAKKIQALVKDGKLEENFMLVEFTRALEKLFAPRIPPRVLRNATRYASE